MPALGAGLLALGAAAPAHAATFTVINTNNAGAGSLRSAINAANQTATQDTIRFAIAGMGVHTITSVTSLPVITQTVSIRGYSQPRSSPAAAGVPGVPTIVIDASNVLRGIDIGGDDNEVRGLVVRDAQGDGIFVEGFRNVVAGNYVGLDAAGVVANPNGQYGVHVDGGQDNRIGGPEIPDRNVIASHPAGDVFVEGGDSQRIEGNYLGSDETGNVGIGGGGGVRLASALNAVVDNVIAFEFSGVELAPDNGDPAEDNDVEGNLIGTAADGVTPAPNGTGVTINGSGENTLSANVISGNSGAGVRITGDDADDNRLEDNRIGTDATEQVDVGNQGSGVEIDGGEQNHVGDPGNTIAFNRVDGVTVVDGSGNAIRKNSIHDNGALGIDLGADGTTPNDDLDAESGPNQLQNGSEIESATDTTVDWELESDPGTDYRLDCFARDACDASGSGEAETYLDSITVTTDKDGDVDGSTVTALAAGAGNQVTMTATKLVGAGTSRSTSELSPCEPTA